MSSFRARSRFAVVATAVPLIAAGVLVAPANAASVTVAPYASIGANNVVGPNAGFRDQAQGVRGNTAVFVLDMSSASASLSEVNVKLAGYPTGPALVLDRDFAQTDGFAVYKDVGASGADGAFSELDFAQGAVSTGYSAGSPSNGQIAIRIAIDGVRATNAARYFVTVHPGNSAGNTENRDFQLTLPANGVRFGDATLSPDTAVQSPRLTIDSKPPVEPVTTSFAPLAQPPMARQSGTPKEDAYNVSSVENNDPDKTLVFLNDGNSVAEANFLRHADGTPVIHRTPTVTSPIYIGDGTGITATSKVALNNQTSDDVFVRAFDTLGNLTTAVRLFDNSTATSGDNVDRSNDVKAPPVTSASVIVNAAGVNAANVAAVPAKISYTGTTGAHNVVKSLEARLLVNVGGVPTTDPDETSAWVKLATASDNQTPVTINVDATTVGTTGSRISAQGRAQDVYGNTTDHWTSATTYLKDTVLPRLASVAFEYDANTINQADSGDRIRATWSEPMNKDSISETKNTDPCQQAPACVNNALTFPSGNISWGLNPTVVWSADQTSVLITVDQPEPNAPTGFKDLPELNDKVRSESFVTDLVGNYASDVSLSDRFIAAALPKPSSVTTADTVGVGRNLYNQGRDGWLDKLTVTFPSSAAIENAATSLPANLANFKIVGSGVQVPTAATVVNPTTFTLTFGGTLNTGETPQLVYTPPATGGLRAGGQDVPAFTVVATDTAAPALQMLTTRDTDSNGKLDTIVADYSEAIDRDYQPVLNAGAEKRSSYKVTGYTLCPSDPLGTAPGKAGATPDVTLIELCEGTTPDTAATPTTETNDWSPVDLEENTSTTGWGTGANDAAGTFNRLLDKAPPVAASRTTRDLNADGRIDAIDVVYSETLDTFSIENAQYIVTGRTISTIDVLGQTGVRINIAPIAQGIAGDTDAKPPVQYTGGPNGGLKDASDQRNPVLAEAAPGASSDGAGPAITAACAGTATNNGRCPVDTAGNDQLNVFFSEALNSDTVQATDFAVEQPAGTNKAVTTTPTMASDNKSVTLTLANNAINPALDATVRFTAANAVMDASSPAQGNAQTANVTAPAPPAVALNLTCPVAATDGYCGSSYVNTGAVATAGLVRFWRLSATARTATTPDSEYSADQPSKYPPTGTLPEGVLKLYLSGKDDFGRLTTEVNDTIEILRSPTLGSVQFLNSTLPASGAWGKTDTVLDGDNIRVGATAFSSDVAKWTASNGGCLAKHMSVDYRGLTHNTAHSAVAPFSCDLKSAPARRVMVFPFVKVSGTTKYPVGTVLKVSANDPGGIIQDGPNGTQIRRQFISVNARRSHMIPDASVITVPLSVVNGIPRGRTVGYRDGSVIKSSTSGYYYVYQSLKRPISAGLLAAWKMPTSQVYTVSTGELNAHATGAGFAYGAHPLGTWVRFSDGSINQITKNSLGQVVRRGVTSSTALKTLVPGTQIYSANAYDRAVPHDASFVRGYRDGTLLRTGTNTYAVVSRTVLRTFANSQTFNSLGFNTANALTFSAGSMPRTPAGYGTGLKIDRYKITTTVIKVTNLAGGTATATVLPTIGGLYGVGNIDPIPANWDASRQ